MLETDKKSNKKFLSKEYQYPTPYEQQVLGHKLM